MCMNDPVRIESKEVPKYGLKIVFPYPYNKKLLLSIFRKYTLKLNLWNKSKTIKYNHKKIKQLINKNDETFLIQFGRLSVFEYNKDIISKFKDCKLNAMGVKAQIYKVEIKQTTKYAYKGTFLGDITYAVDQVKPIELVN